MLHKAAGGGVPPRVPACGALVQQGTGGQFQLTVNGTVWAIGTGAILVMSFAVGLLPALRAQRLRIVDALAGR